MCGGLGVIATATLTVLACCVTSTCHFTVITMPTSTCKTTSSSSIRNKSLAHVLTVVCGKAQVPQSDNALDPRSSDILTVQDSAFLCFVV